MTFDFEDRPSDPFKALDGSVDYTSIYTTFIEQAVLEPEDREKLKKERGFSDEVIDLLKFKSCRPSNARIIEEMAGVFGEEALFSSGLVEYNDQGQTRPCSQLLKPNIVIPFFDETGRIYFIRPHKFGLKDMGIQIYAPILNFTDTLVIAESEFKAAASWVYKVPAIGLPGIHSFAVKNFQRLLEFIARYPKIKKIIILFDNEIKDNPAFPNYKPDVMKQWDTQYRAVQMAKQLERDLPTVRTLIGVLPAEWMVNGKIDIDGALAQGRTIADYRKVIDSATYPEAYVKSLPRAAQRLILQRLHKLFFKSPIVKENFCYFALRAKKGKRDDDDDEPRRDRISNFQMRIDKTIIEGEGYVRQVVFKGQDGSLSRPYVCKPDTVRLSDFKRWIASCGNFVFTGTQEDLDAVYELEYVEASGREIRRPYQIGYLRTEANPCWLFGNCLIKDDGSVLLPDEEGVMWDGLDGYQPRSIKSEGDQESMPTLNLDPTIKLGLPELRKITWDMQLNFENNKSILLGVGWAIACLFSEEIFTKFGSFPILFIAGKRESGKTALGQWLMAMLGMSKLSADSLNNTTKAGIARNLSWYSSLAYWLDEYRNDAQGKKWAGFFRNAYQRQAGSKGTLGANIRSEDIKTGILLSGEETPEDNAFFSRCLIIPIQKGKRNQEIYLQIEEFRQKGLLSRLALEVLKKKKALLQPILQDIQGMQQRLIAKKVGERIALSYAIPAVCYWKVFLENDLDASKDWIKWVTEESYLMEKNKESEHMINVFMDDLVTIREKLIPHFSVYDEPNAKKGKRRIAFYFKAFYSEWTDFYRRKGNDQFKAETMRNYIKEEPYFIEDQKNVRIGPENRQARCMILSLDEHDKPPDGLLTLADGVIAIKETAGSSLPTTIDSPF